MDQPKRYVTRAIDLLGAILINGCMPIPELSPRDFLLGNTNLTLNQIHEQELGGVEGDSATQ
jgi:hypothetical protein